KNKMRMRQANSRRCSPRPSRLAQTDPEPAAFPFHGSFSSLSLSPPIDWRFPASTGSRPDAVPPWTAMGGGPEPFRFSAESSRQFLSPVDGEPFELGPYGCQRVGLPGERGHCPIHEL